jgi:hypothetical protein
MFALFWLRQMKDEICGGKCAEAAAPVLIALPSRGEIKWLWSAGTIE